MGNACAMHKRDEEFIHNLSVKLKGKDSLGDTDVFGRLIYY